MARRIRDHDWAATPLGPVGEWPQSLRTAVDILLGSGHAMQLAWGAERTILYNDAYAPMLGDRHPGALGLPFHEAWPDVWAEIEPLVERVFAGETVRFEEMPLMMTRHGYPEETWWNFSYSPVRDEFGAVAGLLNVTVDATGKVRGDRAETALRESETRLRNVLNGMDEAFGLLDRDFRILTFNDAALRLETRPLEDILGRTHWEVYPGSENSEIGRLLKSAMEERKPVSLEHLYTWENGQTRWLEMRAYPVPGGLAVFWRDISERKVAEKRLRASEERQAFLLRLSDDFRAHPDEEAVGRTCVEATARHMTVDRCYITELSSGLRRGLVGPEYHGSGLQPISGVHRYVNYPDAMRDLMDGVPFVTWDVDRDPRLSARDKASIGGGLGLQAMISAPLNKGRGDSIWALTVGSVQPRAWTSDDLRLVQEVGERTWAAIQRARAEAALRERDERNAFLVRFSDAVRGVSDPALIQETACSLLAEQIGTQRTLWATIDWTTRDYVTECVIESGRRVQEPPRWPLDPSEPFVAEHLEGRAVAYTDIETDPRIPDATRTAMAERGMRAGIAVPVVIGGILRAVLNTSQPMRPRQWRPEEVMFAKALAGRAWAEIERARAETALRVNEEQLRAFGEASSDVLWIRNAETLAWEYLSPAFERIYGISREAALRGNTMENWLDLIVPKDRKRAQEQIEKARQGERVVFDYRIIRPSDGEVRLLRNTDFPIRDAAGHITRIGGVGHDATEEQAAAERLQVLVHELQHRTRNLMAVVQSVTDRTLAGSTSLDDFQDRIRDRLGALARVNGLLSRLNEGDRIAFDELIRTELKGYGVIDGNDQGPQVSLQGPKGMRLRSSQVQTLALGLHELATNALKYGALSRPQGRLDISWRLVSGPDGQRRLQVDWRETGVEVAVPPATALAVRAVDGRPPRRRGYGRELIERALPYQLKAETSYELTPEGVRCRIILPLSSTPGDGGTDMEKKNA